MLYESPAANSIVNTTENYDDFNSAVSSTTPSSANGGGADKLSAASTPIQKTSYTIFPGLHFNNGIAFKKQQNKGFIKRKYYLNIDSVDDSKSAGIGINASLLSLLILFAIIIITYKMVIVTMPYAKTESLFEISSYAQHKFHETLKWVNEKDLCTTLYPLICGLAVALLSFVLVHIDSNVPGVNPPSPFSPKSKLHYRQQRRSSIQLSYIMALAAGVVVSILMYCDF